MPLYFQPAIEYQSLNPIEIYTKKSQEVREQTDKKIRHNILYEEFLKTIDINQDGIITEIEEAKALIQLGYKPPITLSKLNLNTIPRPSLKTLEELLKKE